MFHRSLAQMTVFERGGRMMGDDYLPPVAQLTADTPPKARPMIKSWNFPARLAEPTTLIRQASSNQRRRVGRFSDAPIAQNFRRFPPPAYRLLTGLLLEGVEIELSAGAA